MLERLFLKAGVLHDAMTDSNLQRWSRYLGRGRLDSSDFMNIARQVAAQGLLHDAMTDSNFQKAAMWYWSYADCDVAQLEMNELAHFGTISTIC